MRHIRHFFLFTLLALLFASPAQADAVLPEGLTVIEAQAFMGDTSLSGTLIIPDGVTEIGAEAFKGCTGLTGIVLPDSVMKIGAEAFSGCVNLRGNVLLRYYTEKDDSSFSGCEGLTVRQETDVSYFSYQVIDDTYVRITALNDSTYSGELIIPECIEGYPVYEIGNQLQIFGWVHSTLGTKWVPCHITGLHLPDTIKSIGNRAFQNFFSVTSINLPDSIIQIGIGAFSSCSGLTHIDLPNSMTSVSDSTFSGCTSLNSVDLHEGITVINDSAFTNCTALTQVALPSTLTSIGNSAFKGCSGLTGTLTLPESLTSIGAYAFCDCTGLEGDFTFYGDVTVSASAFQNTAVTWFSYAPASHFEYTLLADGTAKITAYTGPGVTDLYIPLTLGGCPVSVIGEYAFQNRSDIDGIIVLPDTVTAIEGYAFESCSNVDAFQLSASLKTIDAYCFAFCTSLKSMTFPDGFESIKAWRAFEGCSSIESIILPDSTTNIARCSFGQCTSLKHFVIPPKVPTINDCTFYGCRKLEEVIIPTSVTTIENNAFYDCQSLVSIEIPDSVTSFNSNYAFEMCYALESVKLPKSLTSIGINAFKNCTSLKQITIPSGVTGLSSYSFYNCSSLTSIVLPASVTGIGTSAFENCTSLTHVDFSHTAVSFGIRSFANTGLSGSISLPYGSEIHDTAFDNCVDLTHDVFTQEGYVEYVTRHYLETVMDGMIPPDQLFGNMKAENSEGFQNIIYTAVSIAQLKIDELLTTQNKMKYLFHEALKINSAAGETKFINQQGKQFLENGVVGIWKNGKTLTELELYNAVSNMCGQGILGSVSSATIAQAFSDFESGASGSTSIASFLTMAGLSGSATEEVLDTFKMLTELKFITNVVNTADTTLVVYNNCIDTYNQLKFLDTLDRDSLRAAARVYVNSNDLEMRAVGAMLQVIADGSRETQIRQIICGAFTDFALREIVNTAIDLATDLISAPLLATIKFTNALLNTFTGVGEVPRLIHEITYAADAASGTYLVFQGDLAVYHADPTEEKLTRAYESYITYLSCARTSQNAFYELNNHLEKAPLVSLPENTAWMMSFAKKQVEQMDARLERGKNFYRLRQMGDYDALVEYLRSIEGTY